MNDKQKGDFLATLLVWWIIIMLLLSCLGGYLEGEEHKDNQKTSQSTVS